MVRHLAVLLMLAASPVIASEPDRSALLLSRAHWAGLDWRHLADDPIARGLPGVRAEDAEKDEGFRHGIALREGEITVFGRTGMLSLRERRDTTAKPRGILLSGFEKSSRDVCTDVLAALEDGLGRSSLSHDLSYTRTNGSVTSRRAQWTIGDSRIGFFCHVLSMNGRTDVAGVWQVFAWAKSAEPQDKPLTWISCSVDLTGRVNGEDRKRSLGDLIFAIDEYGNALLSEDSSPVASTATVTATRVSFMVDDEGVDTRREGSINRLTGEYFETVSDKTVPNFQAFVRGRCTKIDRTKRAF